MAVKFLVGFNKSGFAVPVSFEEVSSDFFLEFGEVINTGHFPLYAGEYEVTPKIEAQTLNTANRSMERDVTIHAIPYYEVDNDYNGQTIVIGGN